MLITYLLIFGMRLKQSLIVFMTLSLVLDAHKVQNKTSATQAVNTLRHQ